MELYSCWSKDYWSFEEFIAPLIDLFNTISLAITRYLRTEPESRDSSELRELGWTPQVIDAVTDTFNRTSILDELNTRLLTFPHEQNRRLAKEQKEELYR